MANIEIQDGHQYGCPPKLHLLAKNGISKWSDDANNMAAKMAANMADTTSNPLLSLTLTVKAPEQMKFGQFHPEQSANAGRNYSIAHKTLNLVFLHKSGQNTHRSIFCRPLWSNLLET